MKAYINGHIVEVAVTQPTKEEIKASRLVELEECKVQLIATDYKAIKYAEGELSAEEYEPIRIERRNLRARINELEKAL